ncbi:Rpn family recombination-promoting nuclease/putative transposase [Treponema rectale]|uniref:Putative transposase/invertase (TIGR01784 family) n=1 Tax=Treponema rectale TaxID=744512 RepID=A0A840S5E2_9SPIR|nr:Rpn family recombination-promoting nuclease/putative transposase [Treponema rectale]MBB5217719.1 putative transposase/invertase (TIGR01784 family) [Treponema rectale]QOS40551.1 Rpn family recombination-promoting nuclease/putative transposase [Treponema rectale]
MNGQFTRPWKDLTFKDNFIFCKVMKNEEICRKMLEILLKIKVEKIEYIESEKTIENYYESRGIRLDVYVKDSDRIFDIEIQTGNYDDLLLRARYYQGACDVATVRRRTKFRNLKETYIVFICEEDPFGMGLPVYTKKNRFTETDALIYDDKTHAVFYNSSAWSRVQDEELRDVLRFIYESKATSSFSKLLEENTLRAKSRPEMEDEYMYFMDILEEEKEYAREAGLAEGREAGRTQGLAEGRETGRAEGARQNAVETAGKLLREGVSLQTVIKCTGLSENDIKNIK